MKRRKIIFTALFCSIFGTMAPLSFFAPVHAATQVIPNDPLFFRQSYLGQIHASDAWLATTGSDTVLVAVLDSGMDTNHPDLVGALWVNTEEIPGDGLDNDGNGYVDDINGWDFINDIPDPNPKFGGEFSIEGINHGTLLSGIIAARGNNNLGITGISWHSRIMPLRVLNNKGGGNVFTVVKAIDYAIKKKARVINLSFIGNEDSSFLRAAVKRAVDAGVIVVAASGNDQSDAHGFDLTETPIYPACFNSSIDGILSVGSIDSIGQKAQFSPYGTCIDIMAPGTEIFSTQKVQYERAGFDLFYGGGWSGTSLSTAMVSGVIALMLSVDPSLQPADIRTLIKTTCDPIDALNPSYVGKLGCGELNAGKLVTAAIARARSYATSDGSTVRVPHIGAVDRYGRESLRFFTGTGESKKSIYPFFPFAPFRVPYTIDSSEHADMTVVAAGAGAGPHIRLFDRSWNMTGQFFAYDKRFRGGVVARIGDVDGDGEEDIVTAPASRGGAQVSIFSRTGLVKRRFFAFDAQLRSGYSLALADLNNDGKDEIIISAENTRAQGEVRMFGGDGTRIGSFVPYPENTSAQFSLAVGHVMGEDTAQIIVAPMSGKGAVKIFSSIGILKTSFFPYGETYHRGVSLAVGDINRSGGDEIVVAPLTKAPAHVQIFNGAGKRVGTFFASQEKSRSGFIVSILY